MCASIEGSDEILWMYRLFGVFPAHQYHKFQNLPVQVKVLKFIQPNRGQEMANMTTDWLS